MAPENANVAQAKVDEGLRQVHQSNYNLIVQAVNNHGSVSENAMRNEVQRLARNLTTLARDSAALDVRMPAEMVKFVETGRNPNIHQRQFVEAIQKKNQAMKGRMEGYAKLRDTLAMEFAGAVPEMRDHVREVVESSGGKLDE